MNYFITKLVYMYLFGEEYPSDFNMASKLLLNLLVLLLLTASLVEEHFQQIHALSLVFVPFLSAYKINCLFQIHCIGDCIHILLA